MYSDTRLQRLVKEQTNIKTRKNKGRFIQDGDLLAERLVEDTTTIPQEMHWPRAGLLGGIYHLKSCVVHCRP